MKTNSNGWLRLLELLLAAVNVVAAWQTLTAFIGDFGSGHLTWT